jgi:hypothetical protein
LASWSRRPGRPGRRRSRPGALTAAGHGQEAVPKPGRPPGQSPVLGRGAASAIDTVGSAGLWAVGCAGDALPTQQGSPLTRTSLWVRSARPVWRPVPPQAVPWWAPLSRRTPQGGHVLRLRREPSAREDEPGSPTTRTQRTPWSPH